MSSYSPLTLCPSQFMHVQIRYQSLPLGDIVSLWDMSRMFGQHDHS